ncbi:prolyl oligopeptidase family serine peptidase [Paludibacterium paludis]|uniref:Prolyl oligopeptidase n=1 Tax=Paludibacterium paludis TaxID=1225769 RepID=A0A918U8I9_9NEIS|nr:prolyl oligopeptidase family serine peptidase [Paludibacterium paludis]GGY09492.1 prolyl oligopeptidase [Paludibacterium paludis]
MTRTADPYQWLESLDGADARAWVGERNERARAALEGDARFPELKRAILANLRDTRQIPYVSEHDGWLYNFHQDETQPRGVYRRIRPASYREGRQDWHTVLDIDAIAHDEGADWYLEGVSHYTLEPELCLVSLTPGGSDATVTREYHLGEGRFVDDGFAFPLGKSHIAWQDRDTLLVCPGWEGAELTGAGYPATVWRARRGEAPECLFQAPADSMMVAAWRFLCPERGHWDMLEVSDSFYARRHARIVDSGEPVFLPLPGRAEVLAWIDGDLIIKLAEHWQADGQRFAPGSLLAVEGEALREGRHRVQCLIAPDAHSSVESVETTRSAIVVNLLSNVQSRLVGFRRVEGRWQGFALPTPEHGVIEFVDQPWNSDALYYSYCDFLVPSGLYRLQIGDDAPQCLRSQPAAFDAAPFVCEQWHAVADDGTAIPYFIVMPRQREAGVPLPTLLYGYGGFEVPMLPYYVENFGPHWLEKGGAFVVANIRGGGEFGPAWHQAAQGVNKPVSFEDFAAVARDLAARGVTDARHLAIEGGSNGGLLVAASLVRHPELFRAVVCEVPLTDMLRYTRLLAGASWVDEYGDPDEAGDRAALAAYSPYHHVSDNAAGYPSVFLTTSAQDDRVHPAHARKMAARLEEAGADVLFFETRDGGHGGNAGQEATAADLARVLVFLYRTLFDPS